MMDFEIVGYAIDGTVLCTDCAPADAESTLDPIFAGSEWDSAPSCDECHCKLDVCTIDHTDWNKVRNMENRSFGRTEY